MEDGEINFLFVVSVFDHACGFYFALDADFVFENKKAAGENDVVGIVVEVDF